jgi:hypothetical protein
MIVPRVIKDIRAAPALDGGQVPEINEGEKILKFSFWDKKLLR